MSQISKAGQPCRDNTPASMDVCIVDEASDMPESVLLAKLLREVRIKALVILERGEKPFLFTQSDFERQAREWAQGCFERLLGGDGADFFRLGNGMPIAAIFGVKCVAAGGFPVRRAQA